MKRLYILFALVFSVIFTGALTQSAIAATPRAEASAVQPAYLFAFDGENAKVAVQSAAQGRFTLTVPISRGNQLVTWFTDRPIRDAGHLPMASFVDLWTKTDSTGFSANPPNVAISVGSRTVIATMTDPLLVKREGKQLLQTTMTLVKGEALTNLIDGTTSLAANAKRAGTNAFPSSKTFPIVNVFVDDSSGTVCSGWIECCQTLNGTCTVTKK